MRKILFVILLAKLTISLSKAKELKITYIANCGYMIENGNTQILIDALFDEGYNQFEVAHDSITNMIIDRVQPFDKARVLLVTHAHGDHFNASLVKKYLSNNRENRLIGPTSVVNRIYRLENSKHLKNQIIEIESQNNFQIDTLVYGARIKSYFMEHMNVPNYINVGYVIDFNGAKVLHTGDFAGTGTVNFKKLQLQNEQIDVALLNSNSLCWEKESDRTSTKRAINPKRIVLTHAPKNRIGYIQDSITKIENFVDITVFENSLESKTFYINEK